MHELSIVQNILDIAREQVENAGATKVDTIDLEIGDLAGIELDAFSFAWKAATPNTILSHATRNINHIAAVARCTACQHLYQVETLYEFCPVCSSPFSELTQGKELRIRSLVVS